MMNNPLIAEFIGTAILLLLGCGIVANVSLKKTKAEGQSPWVLITSAWGFSVFVGAYVAGKYSGAHLNPAVTIGLATAGKFTWKMVLPYIISQLAGAMFGSWIVYLVYIDHYRQTKDEKIVLSTFSTGPAIRNFKNNFFSEFVGTFILVFCIFFIASPNITFENIEILNFGIGSLESLPVGILVWVIGMGLGGTTGYAINPARDLGPRIVYQFLPRKEKNADWEYSWVPVIGPILGAVISGLCYSVLI
tara:strand:- start:460 stop:1203 length:744 start_codon:yes stop_codon:yes gene_type:complete